MSTKLHRKITAVSKTLHLGNPIQNAEYRVNLRSGLADIKLDVRFVRLGPEEMATVSKLEGALCHATQDTPQLYSSLTMQCAECRRLWREHWEAVETWRELLRTLSQTAMSREAELFRTLWDRATKAQKRCADLRTAMATHRRGTHGAEA